MATHLAQALAPRISAVFSRSHERACALGSRIGVPGCSDFSRVAEFSPEYIIVSVSDKAVAGVASAIGALPGRPLVVHTSGTVGMELLSPISDRVGVLYPLQTFSADVDVEMSRVPFFTETASGDDLVLVDSLARLMSDKVHHADAAHRRVLHVAGVFSSNFPNVLLECVGRILSSAGYPLDVVRPLVEATVAKAFDAGPHNAQTGPARRGDYEVIKRQFESLPQDLRPVYAVLSDLILESHGLGPCDWRMS
ncbi:MAG: DUF2520 domain-containing protein [Muribaculaceae bacterium]|nr:DUF2520 domain-containing protein [Muribaculaceae bacterium]